MFNHWLRRLLLSASGLLLSLSLTGCEKLMRDMYDQPRYKPHAASTLWPDGASARPLEPGTVVHSGGGIAGTSSGRLQIEPLPEPVGPTYPIDEKGNPRTSLAGAKERAALSNNPLPMTLATLQRGRERYDIYCMPCHSQAGDGDGMIVRRGFPRPPTYHSERLRNAPDSHFYSVITHGYGAMYPYADRVESQDRWAIVAYIRALQLSQHATLADALPAERQKLQEANK